MELAVFEYLNIQKNRFDIMFYVGLLYFYLKNGYIY